MSGETKLPHDEEVAYFIRSAMNVLNVIKRDVMKTSEGKIAARTEDEVNSRINAAMDFLERVHAELEGQP